MSKTRPGIANVQIHLLLKDKSYPNGDKLRDAQCGVSMLPQNCVTLDPKFLETAHGCKRCLRYLSRNVQYYNYLCAQAKKPAPILEQVQVPILKLA